MKHYSYSRVPLPWRWLPGLASRLLPRRVRGEWLAARLDELGAWWTLVDRGEIATGAAEGAAALCRRAFADALAQRFPPIKVSEWVRSAVLVPVAVAAVLLAAAAPTGGFAGARWLARTATAAVRSARGEDALVGVGFLVSFATLVGIALVIHARPGLERRNWRYWIFLAFKTISVAAVVPLIWFEAVYALRMYMPPAGLPALAVALGINGALVGSLAGGLWWCFDDQRRRCPECLDRLTLPVRFGLWSSVLEPVTTEMVCPRGHGALTLPESETVGPDHWTAMDESWRSLFQAAN